MEKLRDIKGIVEVPDTSLWWLIGTAAAFILALLLLLWLYRTYFMPRRRRRRKSPEQIAAENLRAIDYGDTKEAVYTFSENMKLLADLKGPIPGLHEMLERLEKYKYKREVPPLSKEDKNRMQKMIKEVLS